MVTITDKEEVWFAQYSTARLYNNATREESPLIKAVDAIEIDNSNLTLD